MEAPWNLAEAYGAAGRHQEAIAVLEPELARLEHNLSWPTDLDAASLRRRLVGAYLAVGRDDDAAEILTAQAERVEASYGQAHPQSLEARHQVADAYLRAGRVDDAVAALREIDGAVRRSIDQSHPVAEAIAEDLRAALAGQTAACPPQASPSGDALPSTERRPLNLEERSDRHRRFFPGDAGGWRRA
ncbi:MAG: tetratricopeptide repeat protein [Bifidobacteriaceae bacterium]|nr:tetratricopeptide repeat protein [Bifidobacteriaceae bacterium]